MKSDALIDAITGVTKTWTKQRKREERERSAALNRRYFLIRRHTVSIREAAWRAIPDAYMKASANNKLSDPVSYTHLTLPTICSV